jgi:hypothetical protein
MADDLEPTDAELRDVTDEARRDVGKPPMKRTPEQGIADMKQRIKDLTELKRKLLEQMEARTGLDSDLRTINTDLSVCRQRLAEYEAQLAGKN